MSNKITVDDLITPIIEELGFEVVRITMIPNKNPILQIMIEHKDRSELVVEDCAKVSRAISEILDEKDPISGEYALEVSSPGLDRPLVTLEHFVRFVGYEVKLETKIMNDGRKRFSGKVLSVDEKDNIVFEMEEKTYTIPFDDINKAKLILTDELFNAYMEAHHEVEL